MVAFSYIPQLPVLTSDPNNFFLILVSSPVFDLQKCIINAG